MHVWLIGMMGSGKSVTGAALAEKLGVPFVDSDREIESVAGASISEIFRTRGEGAFRALEKRVLGKIAARERCVIATGGGAILDPQNVSAMRSSGCVVWLQADVDTLARRAARAPGKRPLLAGRAPKRTLAKLLEARTPLYERAADVTVATKGAPSRVAGEIPRGATRTVGTARGGYSVRVENGLLASAGAQIRARFDVPRLVVVADPVVARHHGEALRRTLRRARFDVEWIPVRAGESQKTLATVGRLWRELVRRGVDRSTPIVAFGGGVLGDMAGFAAATVLRGVPLVQIPTTLVAQVDSSIGGKTGFDLPEGKNLVGAFKDPDLVLVDPALLATLPRRQLRAGMAEVVKSACIADAAFFELLERHADSLDAPVMELAVWRCVRIKAGVVERDPLEKGERVILNFGHTIGHAVEAAAGYRGVLHGEAVAIGMTAEAQLAVEQGWCHAREATRLEKLLSALGLPTRGIRAGAARFVRRDKKRKGSAIRMPVLRQIGRVDIREISTRHIERRLRVRSH